MLRHRLRDANGAARVVPEDRLPGVRHFMCGDHPGDWRRDVPGFAAVRIDGLYPGKTLRLRGADGLFEWDLLLETGTDLGGIEIEVAGADALRLAPDGSLEIDTVLGLVRREAAKPRRRRVRLSRRSSQCRRC